MNIWKWLRGLGEKGEVAVAPPGAAGVTAPITLPPASDGKPPVTPPAFVVPDLYKDKPYVKDIKSSDDLWKMFDGAQTMIGQRPAGIPAADAPQADWDKFYEAAGRPKTAAEYAFDYGKDAKGEPIKGDPEVEGALKQMLFEEGLSSKQAGNLQKKFDAIVAGIAQKKGIAAQQQNVDFDKLGKDTFGAELPKVLERGKGLLNEFTPPALKPHLDKLSNEALMIMAGVLNGVHAKFIKTDGAPGAAPGGVGAGGGADALRAEARQLMTLPEYTNSMHSNHETVKAKIADLYKRAAQSN